MARTSRTRRFAIALVSAALVATGLGVVGATSATAAGSMLGEVNSARAKHGERPLDWNSHLASVAKEQVDRMARKRELYHNPNLAADVGNYRWVGENVGYGPSSEVIQDAFMDSPGHRANILDGDFTQIGIAEKRDSKGRLWIAQVFRKPLREASSSGNATAPKKKPQASTKKREKSSTPAPSRSVTKKPAPRTTSTPAPTRSAAAKPAPKPRRPAATPPRPAPQPTLAERVAYVQQAAGARTGDTDPVATTFAFAAAMNAVAG